jgi:hypothetical protein
MSGREGEMGKEGPWEELGGSSEGRGRRREEWRC